MTEGSPAPGTLRALAAHPVCRAVLALDRPPDLAVVGGTVRDLVLGRPNPDLDITVAADPAGLAAILRERLGGTWFVLDERWDVVRYHGPGLVVDLAARQGEDWEADLRRRDLTINAMGVVLASGGVPVSELRLLDPTGGAADLAGRTVRAISRENLRDDPLRLLRVYRFSAALDFAIEPRTRAWTGELAPEAGRVAGERLRDELFKLLAVRACAPHLADMADAGVLEAVVPELAWLRGTASTGHFDGLSHRLETMRSLDWLLGARPPWSDAERAWLDRYLAAALSSGRPRLALARAGLLWHDLDPWAPHPPRGAVLGAIAGRLRLATAETKWLGALARGLAAFGALAGARPGGADILRFFRAARGAGAAAALLGLADHRSTRDLSLDDDAGVAATTRALLREAMHPAITDVREPLVRGDDLARALGIEPGPQLAALVRAVAEARADGLVATRDEAVGFARQSLVEGRPSSDR